MFEILIVIVIGVLLIYWLKRSQGASRCSGCSGCPYQCSNPSMDSPIDSEAEPNQPTLDRVKSGKLCQIKSLPPGTVKDQTIRFGLTEGKEVLCQAVIPAGPVVLKVDRQEIAVGRNLAKQIRVARESETNEK